MEILFFISCIRTHLPNDRLSRFKDVITCWPRRTLHEFRVARWRIDLSFPPRSFRNASWLPTIIFESPWKLSRVQLPLRGSYKSTSTIDKKKKKKKKEEKEKEKNWRYMFWIIYEFRELSSLMTKRWRLNLICTSAARRGIENRVKLLDEVRVIRQLWWMILWNLRVL